MGSLRSHLLGQAHYEEFEIEQYLYDDNPDEALNGVGEDFKTIRLELVGINTEHSHPFLSIILNYFSPLLNVFAILPSRLAWVCKSSLYLSNGNMRIWVGWVGESEYECGNGYRLFPKYLYGSGRICVPVEQYY